MRELDYVVMGHAFACHNELGRVCDESMYQVDLAARLEADGVEVEREVPVTVRHGDFEKSYFLDWVVGRQFVYEAKATATIIPAHRAQVLNYLFLTDTEHGKIINFRPSSVEHEYVNATVDHAARREARVVVDAFDPSAKPLRDLLLSLVDDWGLFLETSLYTQAVSYFVAGESGAARQVPMHRGDINLGTQRFTMFDDISAFDITALKSGHDAYATHLRRKLDLSPLHAIHWINLWQREIRLISIQK